MTTLVNDIKVFCAIWAIKVLIMRFNLLLLYILIKRMNHNFRYFHSGYIGSASTGEEIHPPGSRHEQPNYGKSI